MPVFIEGDRDAAQDVLHQIELWDKAVVGKCIDDLMQKCTRGVSMFDVSSQLTGAHVYREQWEKFSPYFNENMQITRRDVKLYTSKDLAVLHCYSKVENTALTHQAMPWCRTTLCLQKRDGVWLVVHQHISMPVNIKSGNAIFIEDVPKLRLVI
ncbi:ketosteroid isomerase-like protein [Acinetobacter calcoaceticus]|uniref:Ketosteroid isomerase-like protein n=1 Tax=Acinetobacter calcoaceticus TaxID=471 RepID=A0A4R1XUB9_ACICA|nr:ketosteroid isomerase-like protein [Acinetobacter calcoaceticus]